MLKKILCYSILPLAVTSVSEDDDLQLIQTRIAQKGPEKGWTLADLKSSSGENKCLNLESSGWTNWDCNGLEGRSAAVPSYCKTTNSNYKRAVPDNCCKDECDALKTGEEKSKNETTCLMTSGTGNWSYSTTFDCDGVASGTQLQSYMGVTRRAAAPGFCLQ